ncbi:hypothetical protein ACVWXB_004219 [Streptomyces sp. TE12347]
MSTAVWAGFDGKRVIRPVEPVESVDRVRPGVIEPSAVTTRAAVTTRPRITTRPASPLAAARQIVHGPGLELPLRRGPDELRHMVGAHQILHRPNRPGRQGHR